MEELCSDLIRVLVTAPHRMQVYDAIQYNIEWNLKEGNFVYTTVAASQKVQGLSAHPHDEWDLYRERLP